MLLFYVSNIFIKNAFVSKTRANSAKRRPFSESAHLIYPETVEISSAKICVLTSVINTSYYFAVMVSLKYGAVHGHPLEKRSPTPSASRNTIKHYIIDIHVFGEKDYVREHCTFLRPLLLLRHF